MANTWDNKNHAEQLIKIPQKKNVSSKIIYFLAEVFHLITLDEDLKLFFCIFGLGEASLLDQIKMTKNRL